MKHSTLSIVLTLVSTVAASNFTTCVQNLGDKDLAVLTPGNSDYANACQPFNLRFNYTPQAILFPTTTEEVSQILGCTFRSNLSISIRSGGHSYAAYALAGEVVLDLSELKALTVHPNGTAVIQTGNKLGDVATGLWNSGKRALPHGSCPYVGTGGHATLGGYGFFSRKAGLLQDTVESAQVVLADGRIVIASSMENPDLFWAIRGAGPSFGVVTAWTFQTLPAPTSVVDFQVNFGSLTQDEFTSALISYENFGETAPDEMAIQTVVGPNGNGGVFLSFQGDYYGNMQDFHQVLDPWTKTLPDVNQTLTASQLDWLDALVAKDGNLSTAGPDVHDTFFAKSLLVTEPSSNASLAAWVNFMFTTGTTSNISWFAEVDMWGGAIGRVPANSTSFSHRDAKFGYQIYSSSPGSVPPYPNDQIGFVNDMWATLSGNDSSSPAYTNYVDPTLDAHEWPIAYYSGSFGRLVEIKKAVDPLNVFRFNQSIPLVDTSSNSTSLPSSQPTPTPNDATSITPGVFLSFILYFGISMYYSL